MVIAQIREQVRQHVCSLPDDELLKYAYGFEEAYEPEAIEMAREEAARRGLKEPLTAADERPDEVARRPPAFEGSIVEDRLCLQCGYNLRGLSAGSNCPECGLPAGWTLSGDALRDADQQWVRRIGAGLELAVWCMVLSVGAVVLRTLAWSWFYRSLWPFELSWWVEKLGRVGVGVGVLAFASREPQAVLSRGSWLRQLLRGMYTFQLVHTLLSMLPSTADAHVAIRLQQISVLLDPVTRYIVYPVQAFLLFRYCACVLGRTGRHRLQAWLGYLQWIALAIAIGSGAPGVILRYTNWRLPMWMMGCLGFLAVASALAFGVSMWLTRGAIADEAAIGARRTQGAA